MADFHASGALADPHTAWRLPAAVDRHPIVRIVAPCGPLVGHEAALNTGIARLEAAGCEVRFDVRRVSACDRGYLAGDDAARADELMSALVEPGVEIVWFARGGSGGARTAAQVARVAAAFAPRAVVGFSDATTLLNLLASRLGWVTFHGPVVTSLGRPEVIDFDLDAGLAVLQGAAQPLPPASDSAVLRGRLFGGNLTVLAGLCGTPCAMPSVAGAIVLLEDVGEAPYRLDRSLTQLRQTGVFDRAAGVYCGDLGLPAADVPGMLAAMRADVALPVVEGAPAGHRGRLALLPLGAQVEIDAAGNCAFGRVVRPG